MQYLTVSGEYLVARSQLATQTHLNTINDKCTTFSTTPMSKFVLFFHENYNIEYKDLKTAATAFQFQILAGKRTLELHL
jgi:hypothetical protein